MLLKRIGCVGAVILLAANVVRATEFFVAAGGADAGQGTKDQPFATIERAWDTIRELKKAGPLKEPVTVRLLGGVYALSQAVVFGPEDSGTASCPVNYMADGNEPVVLDGGRRVAGWRKHNDKLWVADLPDVAKGQWAFRQLYVNGQQRTRARMPNEGFFRVAGCPQGTPKKGDYHKDCDWNLYYNPTQKVEEVAFNKGSWAEWRKRGKDTHSRYADPLFANPDQGDFTLKLGSPALALGFLPIDVSQVGPCIKTGSLTE